MEMRMYNEMGTWAIWGYMGILTNYTVPDSLYD